MKIVTTIICAALIAVPAAANPVPVTAPPVATAVVDDIGIAPSDAELEERAGAVPVAIAVLATGKILLLKCVSNFVCRIAAQRAAIQAGTRVKDYIYETHGDRMKRAACRIGVKRYC